MSASATVLLNAIDWTELPPDVWNDIRELWALLGDYPRTEICRMLGLKEAELTRRIEAIRAALVESAFTVVDDLDAPARERLLVEADRLTAPRS